MTPRAWGCFAAVSVLWGIPYLLIKVAVEEGVPPTVVVFARVALGAAVLLPFALAAGGLRELRGRWGAVGVLAALDIAAPFLLITVGVRTIPSALAGMLVATVPLLVALLAVRFDESERVRGPRLVGLFVGLVGVALLLGVEVSGDPAALLGAGLVLLAALSYAAATLYVKRAFAGVRASAIAGGTLGLSTIVLAVPALLQLPAQAPGGAALGALVALGLLSTALAYLLFYALVAMVGAGRASVITYVAPAVAVVAGVTVLDESLTAGAVAGLLLVLAGSWLSTGGRPPRMLQNAQPVPITREDDPAAVRAQLHPRRLQDARARA